MELLTQGVYHLALLGATLQKTTICHTSKLRDGRLDPVLFPARKVTCENDFMWVLRQIFAPWLPLHGLWFEYVTSMRCSPWSLYLLDEFVVSLCCEGDPHLMVVWSPRSELLATFDYSFVVRSRGYLLKVISLCSRDAVPRIMFCPNHLSLLWLNLLHSLVGLSKSLQVPRNSKSILIAPLDVLDLLCFVAVSLPSSHPLAFWIVVDLSL